MALKFPTKFRINPMGNRISPMGKMKVKQAPAAGPLKGGTFVGMPMKMPTPKNMPMPVDKGKAPPLLGTGRKRQVGLLRK